MVESEADRVFALAREVSVVGERLSGVSNQLTDLKDYMVRKFDKQHQEDRDAKDAMEAIIADITGRLEALESKNTYRGGMLAAAVAIGGVIGWLATGSNALFSILERVQGVSP